MVAQDVPVEESVRVARSRSRAIDREFVRRLRMAQLARRGFGEQVARTLRGAGHPHSAVLAAHFEEPGDEDLIQLTVASLVTPHRARRR